MLSYILRLILYMLLSTSYCKNLSLHDDNLQTFLTNKIQYINEELDVDITEHLITERDIHKNVKFLSYETVQIGYDEVKFIRTIYYKNKELIVICLKSGISNIYIAEDISEISSMQSIDALKDVVDVKLFVNNEKLYLVTSGDLGTSLSVTLIYEWTGTYFDKIKDTFSKKTNLIFTFSTPNTEIIIVSQNSGQSLIYEFRNHRLIKIQILQILNTYYVTKYVFNGKIFLIFFNRDFGLMLYQWNDIEMVYLNSYDILMDIEAIHLDDVNNIPILFLATKGELIIYSLNENLNQLANYTFDDSFLQIYGMDTINHNNKLFLYFIAKTENDSSRLISIELELHSTETDSKIREEDALTLCLSNLQNTLDEDEEQIRSIKENNYTLNVPLIEEPAQYESNEITSSSVWQQNNIIEQLEDNLSKMIQEAIDILNEIISNLSELFRTNIGIFESRINILGGLKASTLKGDRIYTEKLNSVEWSPEHWLSYNNNQIFTGKLKANHIIIKNLILPDKNLFDDVLLLNGNQKLNGFLTFNSLQVKHLYTDVINGIPLDSLYFKGDFRMITGRKRFNILQSENLTIVDLNQRDIFDYLKYFTAIENRRYNSSVVTIKNLEVQTINEIHWNTFKDSIFKNGTTNRITGDLIIKKFKAEKLSVKSINNINPENILTKETNQNISVNINFGRLNVKGFICPDINGVNFATDIITTLDENTTITGPVTFERIQILKNFHLNYTNPNSARNNVFNGRKYEMQQIYKRVKIIGDVKVENLIFLPNTSLILNGKSFSITEIPNKYWLRNTPQSIPVPVEVLGGITAPSIITPLLNGIEISEYMINDLGDKLPSNYLFHNLTVIGDVIINRYLQHFPNLTKLNETSVKLTGSYEIFGKKTFKNNLLVNKAEIKILDDVETREAINIGFKAIPGKKQFETLIIKGNLTCSRTYIHSLNDIELNDIYKKFLSGNHSANLDSLKIKDITVKNLETTKLNNENLNKIILNLDNLRSVKTLKHVEINGDVAVKSLANITYLNGINFNVIAEKIAGDPIMTGKIRFEGHVFINNLRVSNINNVSLQELTENVIYRYSKNNIKAKQYFKKLRTPSLQCRYINNYDMSDLISVKEKRNQTLTLRNTLKLKQAQFMRSLSGKLPCDAQEILRSIANPPTRSWSTVSIIKNATIEEDKHIVSSILANAIVIGKDNNVTAPVTFSRVTAKNVYTKKEINSINIEEIYEDALLKSNRDELINGTKTFVKLTAAGAVVHGNAEIPTINKLWIEEIHRNIISKDQILNTVIKGHKVFANGLIAAQLFTNEISGIIPENLVSLDNLKPIPYAAFDKLHVLHNFHIFNVNGVNFTNFLKNRVLKNSTTRQVLSGIYYFDNIHISGEAWTPSLNKINLNNIVFDIGIQNISSPKEFAKDLVIYGDVTIDRLNGINLTEKYADALLTSKEIEVDNIVFKGITKVNSVSAKNLNGIPIKSITAMLQSETPKVKANIVHDTINKIQEIIRTNTKIAEDLPSEYIYLDKYLDFNISIPNPINSQAIETNNHAIIHVLTEEPGHTCGLSPQCRCLIQNTIQITPELSINLFPNKGNQRIYSFEDSSLIIHVITDSISYSMECRNSNTSSFTEYTTLTWISKATGRSIVYNDEVVNGYIDNVDFFSINNYVYIILSKLYDIRKNNESSSHCIVLRLSKDKDLVEIIQKISITRFGKIYAFETKQGVNLVLGNAYYVSQEVQSSMVTVIYKFNLEKQEFVILREILGIRCISVTSVVLGIDSFVILSQKTGSVTFWKYNHHYENYYFYQKLILDSSVNSISSFYSGGFAEYNEAFISLVTEKENFYIYNYAYMEGWKMLSHGEVEGLRLLSPFSLNKQIYLFAPFSRISSLLSPVKQGRD
ncbi:hypothetical protein Trydic_g5112 [Trypoxylus dichotomus]